jgi:RecG-like helicase
VTKKVVSVFVRFRAPLVTTTVIEVGVNGLVFGDDCGAERFGLSQLHQLRGHW